MAYLSMLPPMRQQPLRNPQVTIRKELEQIVLTITDATHIQVNNLRKAILTEINGVAIDKVVIIENSTGVIDEEIVFRVNMIPINVLSNSIKMFENGQVENGTNSYKFTLEKVCEEIELCQVYSGDLIWEPLDNQDPFNGPTILYDDLQIVSLAPGQELKLTAYAFRNKSSINSKFSPIRDAYYRDDGKFPPTFTFYIGLLHDIDIEDLKQSLTQLPNTPQLEFIDGADQLQKTEAASSY